MKKFMLLLFALLVLTTCVGAWAEESVEEKVFVPGEELVLFEQDGVRVYLTGEYEGSNFTYLDAIIENNTKNDIALSYRRNDTGTGFEWLPFCPKNSGEYRMPLMLDSAYVELGEIDFTFTVSTTDNTGNEKMWFEVNTDLIHFDSGTKETEDNEDTIEGKVFFPGEELLMIEQDGVKLYLTGEIDDHGETTLGAVLENNTGKMITASYNLYGGVTNYGFGPQFIEDGDICESGIFAGYEGYESLSTIGIVFSVDALLGTGADMYAEQLFEVDLGMIRLEKAYELLEVGSKGENVKALQEKLIALGYLSGGADGIYGKGTASGVSSFQTAEGLEVTGVADPVTQSTLFSK